MLARIVISVVIGLAVVGGATLVPALTVTLEAATLALALVTAGLAVAAGVQAWMTRRLAEASMRHTEASVMQLKALAPPSLHLVLQRPHGVDIKLRADEGQLIVGIHNLGQAAAEMQWVRVKLGGEFIHTNEDKYVVIQPGGGRYGVRFSLSGDQVDLAQNQDKLPVMARYVAEGSGLIYDWRARFSYDAANDRWEREGMPRAWLAE